MTRIERASSISNGAGTGSCNEKNMIERRKKMKMLPLPERTPKREADLGLEMGAAIDRQRNTEHPGRTDPAVTTQEEMAELMPEGPSERK